MRITQEQSNELHQYLFHDKNESAMLGLCGFDSSQDESLLLLHKLIPIPYEICERYPDFISWPTEFSETYLKEALTNGLTIVKFHCHPGGYKQFSLTDDRSDKDLFDYYNAFFDDGRPVGSFVMIPNKTVFGRVILPDGKFIDVSKIAIIGEEQHYFYSTSTEKELPEYTQRNQQTFGKLTISKLQKLKIGVVGCSGLGTPTLLELARSGIGELVLVDNKKIGKEHLNRMFGASSNDIGKYKVDFFKEKIAEYKLNVKVTAIVGDVTESIEVLEALSFCDHVFGCTDGYLPRDVVNRLANYYIIGYTDMALGLDADGNGGIDSIVGWVRYLIPGGSSLFTRQMYDSRDLERESLIKENPEEFKNRQQQKYIKGTKEKSPPVISLNATVSSLGVTDFLNRIHPFKYKSELGFCIDFCENKIDPESIYPNCPALTPFVGKGRVLPFLNLIGLIKRKAS
jgi:hypothetical protein